MKRVACAPLLLLTILAGCQSQEAVTTDTAVTDVVTTTAATATVAATATATATDTTATGGASFAAILDEALREAAEEAPLPIVTSAAANENLFMLRLLDEYYGEMPALRSREEISRWIGSMRWRVNHAREIVRTRGLDADIDTLYADCGDFLDVYDSVLTNMGMIDRRAEQQATRDALGGLWEGYKSGSKAQSIAKEAGVDDDDASSAGAAVGIFAGVMEYGKRESQRNAARASALDAEQRRLNDAWSAVHRRAKATAELLARRHRWSRQEAGFSEIRSRDLSEEVKQRPRDPFSRIRYATHRVAKEKPAAILSDAKMCLEAAELVPAAKVYDDVRQSYIRQAAELALLAASTEAAAGGYSARPSLAKPALVYANTNLAAGGDTRGVGQMLRARALAFNGRYSEAVVAATEALNKDPQGWRRDTSFPFLYAKMLSLDGQNAYVGGWLRRAFENGNTLVSDVRTSDDFANYRRGMPSEFRELTTARMTWDIEYGILNDDIIVTNGSPFGMSNARVNIVIRKGARTWSPELKSAWIPPGGSQRFVNVVSIPNDSYDDASGSFRCDECPE
ncbi:MAG TPA: hypothetical protein VF111_12145 [Thermoanaerobaculia bacterium]